MPLDGFVAARNDLDTVSVLMAGTVGSVLSTMPWCITQCLLSVQCLKRCASRHGRWLAASSDDINRPQHWFVRRGVSLHCPSVA